MKASHLSRFASFSDKGNGIGELSIQPGYKDAGLYHISVISTDPEGALDKVGISIHVINVLRPLPTQTHKKCFPEDEGVIELQLENQLPNLAFQVQRLIGRKWVYVVNDNGDRAWYHESLSSNEDLRYAYGVNAFGGKYRWVLFDKEEGMRQG